METMTIREADLSLHERVAFGASAEVYRASWRSPNGEELEVAAKKILIRSDTDIQEQLNLEVNILSRVNHRNVIKYYGHSVSPTHVIIVTEFAAKGSLYDYLKKKGSLPLRQLQKWAIEAARGIQHLKNLQIVHRDIKSPNFLITADDTLKVCDFGIAKDVNATQSTQTDKGTMSWLAPEVYMEGKLSPKADVYSLGIVLWELCTCERPFKGMMSPHVMFKVSNDQYRPEIPAGCPQQLKTLIEECWQQDRRKRPGIDEVVSRLERFAEVEEGEVIQLDRTHIVADAAPTDQIDGPVPGARNIKREDRSTPMDTSETPTPENWPTSSFGPIQATEDPLASVSSMQGAATSADARRSVPASAPPQTAEEDPWNIVADLHITKIQKRDINRKVLNSVTETMCNFLHPEPILPILKSRDALDDGDVADIRSQVRTEAMVDRLLEILKRKSDEAYGIFMGILKNADRDLYNMVKDIEKTTIHEWRITFLRLQSSHMNAYMQAPPKTPHRPYEDVCKITDQDFQDVIAPMTTDQLQKLFLALGLKRAAVEKAERSANTSDIELKALAVLQLWRQHKGKAATREAVLEALGKCGNLEVKSGLQHQWNLSV
ncbi:uncharacterized protein [Amphiura filiformis]|uniref:uncharacterized protein n=1 Tax=Amphiura filiformis TaxID=82378 RepID=UPI003B2206B1